LRKNHFLPIIIISLDNQPGFLVRGICYFVFDLVNNPRNKNTDTLIFSGVILLELEYSSRNKTIDFLFLRYSNKEPGIVISFLLYNFNTN
jgi:hypothetical protein